MRIQQAKRFVLSAGASGALIGFLSLSTPISSQAGKAGVLGSEALKNATILIIRHAEKPASGRELTPTGQQRAEAYAQYFKNLTVDSQPPRPDCLIAAADSNNSQRPRLTLEPLSKALGMPLNLTFNDKQNQELVRELQSKPHGKVILICWRHGKIPTLVKALGADPGKLIPGGKWPDNEYGWLLQLSYDQEGRLIPIKTKRLQPDFSVRRSPH
jgi:hypothetical protein